MDSATIANQLAEYDKGRVTSTDATNAALAQYGVPEIRKTVSGLRTTIANTTGALNNVDPSVTGRTQGSMVTEAQRSRIVANERAPIAEQLGSQGQALSQNQADLSEAMNQATTTANNRVADWNTGRQNLQSNYDMTKKREDDATAAEAARQAAIRDQQNKDREFALAQQSQNFSQAQASAKTAKAPTKLDAAANTVQQFNSLKGKDGKVSNETWQNALNDWTAVGGSVRDFWKSYGDYVNTKYTSSYAGYKNR